MMSPRKLSCSFGGRRSASPNTWMFARSEAIGVRSSWPASAIRWRWAATERSKASSVVLKLPASRASSSRPSTSRRRDKSRFPVSASVRLVKRAIGASATRATSAPRIAARAMPATPTIASSSRILLSSWLISVSGLAISTAPRAPVPIVSTRSLVPFTVRSLSALPLPPAAIALSPALTVIFGEVPCPPGIWTAPWGEMNCT